MTLADLMQWLNLLLLPVFYLQMRIEHRLTKNEQRILGLERHVFKRFTD